MKRSLLSLCFLALFGAPSFSQTHSKYTLTGIILHDASNTPVAGAYVSISGGDKITTNAHGEYTLDLPKDTRPGDNFEVVIYHPVSFGFHKRNFTVKNASLKQSEDFTISRNADMGVVGIIKDKKTGNFVDEVMVTVSSNKIIGYTLPSKITNSFGFFEIAIPKSKLNDKIDYAEVLVRDLSGRYKDFSGPKNILAPIEILLESKRPPVVPFKVGSRKTIAIDVEKGNLITIKASGSMKVGNWIGSSGPEGTTGVLGLSLASYNLVPEYKHACLMYALPGETEWRSCGPGVQFNAKTTGKLEITFEINDNTQGDNSGAYDVEITVED